MLLKPNIKIMLDLNFAFLSRNSVTSLTRWKLVNQNGGHQFYHVYISSVFIVVCWFGVRIYLQSNAKMMHK